MCTMEWHDVEREIYTGPLQENPQEYCNRQMTQKKSHMSESRASNLRRKKKSKEKSLAAGKFGCVGSPKKKYFETNEREGCDRGI